jgi:hypothetical protein
MSALNVDRRRLQSLLTKLYGLHAQLLFYIRDLEFMVRIFDAWASINNYLTRQKCLLGLLVHQNRSLRVHVGQNEVKGKK